MNGGDLADITTAECDGAFEDFLAFDHLILAVSGGADSMALLVLAAEWQARHAGSPAISVATVDHKLRPGSDAEAAFVARESRSRRLSHTTLEWAEPKPRTGLATAARDARYLLLDGYARRVAAKRIAVVTAHHRDDQAETFAMRLARGAGVDGLAAMTRQRPIVEASPVTLLRPLLAFAKARLVATLRERGVGFVEDLTNGDVRYERPRMRRALAALNAAGLSSEALATSARRAADAKEALRYAEKKFVSSLSLSFGHEVFASFERAAFNAAPAYLRQKLLDRLIRRYGGASAPAELSEIESLTARLSQSVSSRQTLGGAIVSAGPRCVRVWRESGRLNTAETPLMLGAELIWDARFVVRLAAATRQTMTVRPLGAAAYLSLFDRIARSRALPARAAHALPSFWAESRLVAVPSLAPYATCSGFPFAHEDIVIRPLAGRSVS